MRWFRWLTALVGAVAVLPFVTPSLGLADYQQTAEPPGLRVAIGNGVLNVRRQGTGPPVVLVHGHPGSAQMMAPLAQALADEGFLAIRYDRMGWGHSGQRPSDQPSNPTAHAEDLLQLVGALGLSHPVVVGYSYGGGVALEASRLAPTSVPVLVTVSSIGRPEPRRQAGLVDRVLFSPAVLRWSFGTSLSARTVARTAFASLQAPESLSDGQLDGLLASLALPGVPGNWAREREERYIGFEMYRPEVVQACTLILHGDDDRVVAPSTAEYLRGQIEGARLRMIRGAGHALVVTRAAELAMLISEHVRTCTRDAEGRARLS